MIRIKYNFEFKLKAIFYFPFSHENLNTIDSWELALRLYNGTLHRTCYAFLLDLGLFLRRGGRLAAALGRTSDPQSLFSFALRHNDREFFCFLVRQNPIVETPLIPIEKNNTG